MKILVLVAGTNDPSNADFLAHAFAEGMSSAEETMEVEMLRIKDLKIHHFTLERYAPACTSDDDFCMLQDKILEACGIVIATPIWNFSIPAHLKNVIDRIGAFALDPETRSIGQLKGKPVFIIFTGGAPMIAWKALMYLTTLHVAEAFKYYGATIVGRHFEPRCIPAQGKFGLVVDKRPESLRRMQKAGASFIRLSKVFRETGRLPLKTRLTRSIFTFFYRSGNRIMYAISEKQ